MAARRETLLVQVLGGVIAAILVLDVGAATAVSAPSEPSESPVASHAAALPTTTTTAPPPGRASESSPAAPSTGPEPEPAPAFPVPPPPAGWTVAGHSVQGRPILMKRFGHGPFKVLWLGGIHGDEIEGSVATAELPAAFAAAAGLADRVTLTVIWDANPDGRAAHSRVNAHGVDLNRDFPAANFGYGPGGLKGEPLSQPESRTVHDLVVKEKPDLVVACHSWRGDQFVNYDGPAGDIANRFSVLSGFPVKTSDQLGPDLSGSMGNWIGVDMGVPILTIEWLHGSDPALGWQRTRAAILAAITP